MANSRLGILEQGLVTTYPADLHGSQLWLAGDL